MKDGHWSLPVPRAVSGASLIEHQAGRELVFHTLDAPRGISGAGVVTLRFSGFSRPIAIPGGYLAVDRFFS
jgi:hypothetical protein